MRPPDDPIGTRSSPFGTRSRLAGDLYEPTPPEVDPAWADYARGLAGGAGIVDRVSFAVMRRLGLTEVFTNDRHFAAAGFTPLF